MSKDTVRFPLFIVDITDDCVVEIDFLRTYKATIALGDESVKLVTYLTAERPRFSIHIGHLFASLVG